MTDIMSYQYPMPTPHNGNESGYLPAYPMPPPILSAMDSSTRYNHVSKPKRAVSSPIEKSQVVAMSRPHVSSSQDASSTSLSGEKKRNKLGYHRTSIACGHCRRRKIRCQPSTNDMHGRCSNCIRLKKECIFDAQAQDVLQKTAPRASMGPKGSSASSSPSIKTQLPTALWEQPPYTQMTAPSIPQMAHGTKPEGKKPYSPGSKATRLVPSTQPYDYGQGGATNWNTAETSSNLPKVDGSVAWTVCPSESPITPAFSPYTPHAAPPTTWAAPGSSDSSARGDLTWPSYQAPPVRLLSYGSDQPPHHYPSIAHAGGSVPSGHDQQQYPGTAVSTPVTETEAMPAASLGESLTLTAGPAIPAPNYASWQQQPYSFAKQPTHYGCWYGASQPQLRPEEYASQAVDATPSNVNTYYNRH